MLLFMERKLREPKAYHAFMPAMVTIADPSLHVCRCPKCIKNENGNIGYPELDKELYRQERYDYLEYSLPEHHNKYGPEVRANIEHVMRKPRQLFTFDHLNSFMDRFLDH